MLNVGRRRTGVTLPELLIALACAGLLFAAIGAIALRQQRLFAELADDAATAGRLREVVATLPVDLRVVSPAAGDIREARDTSIEIRATIASAVACDTVAGGHALVLGPALAGAETYASYGATIAAGDTAWLLDVRDSVERWVPRHIVSVSSSTASICASGGPRPSGTPFTATTLALDTVAPARAGSVLRVTRPVRYSLYQSSDGSWQLGARDWNPATARFNSIQPVAGPLLSPSGGGLLFSYYDSSGAAIAGAAASSASIALITVAARAQTKRPARVLGANGAAHRVDSIDAALYLHNRR